MQKLSLTKSVFIFVLVAAFLVFEMAVQVSPSVITHQLMNDLNLNPVQLGWMSGCYFFTYTLMQIPAGLLYDRFNVRYVIIFPLLICTLGVFLFSFATNFWFASFARILMGTGSAFAFIGVLVVASDIFPNRYFALLTGITQKLAAFGAIGGQLPLLFLVHAFGWRHATLLLAGIGFILALLIYLFVRYRKCPSVIVHQPSMKIIYSLKQVMGKTQIWFIALYACFLWAPMAGFASLWGVPYLTRAYHLSPSNAALAVSIMWLGLAFASPVIGFWSDYIKNRKIPLLFCALICFAGFSTILFPSFIQANWLYVLLFLTGAACSGQSLSFALVKDHTPSQYQAAAIGLNNMAVVVAGAIFQPLIGKLVAWHAKGIVVNPAFYKAGDFQFGLMAIAGVLFAALVLITFLIKEKKS